MILNRWIENLNDILVPHIFKGINKIYNDLRKLTEKTNNGIIKPFQLTLMEIKYLPATLLEEDYTQLLLSFKNNNYSEALLSNLLKKIYIESVKEDIKLAKITLIKNNIKIPNNMLFIHKVYINAANMFFKDPLLFYHKYL